jgi:rRNA maturation endonuclease Nob1
MSSCRDLRNLNDSPDVANAFAKLVSGGKSNYKTVIEKTKPQIKCSACSKILEGNEKFCPECGNKLK